MNLAALVTDIKDEINKGSSISTAQIKEKIKDALTMIELDENWAYMDRFVSFSVNILGDNPRVLPVPTGLKAIEFIRWVNDDGSFSYLTEVSPKDMLTLEDGKAEAYFKDGMQYLWLTSTPEEAYDGEMSYVQFTEWSDSDSWEPWPFKYMKPLVKYQTLVLLAPFIRDPEMMKMHGALLADAKDRALRMNEELQYSNTSNQMVYK